MSSNPEKISEARFDWQSTYPRESLETKIAHIGFGAFHRGHQAVYNDLANEITGELWGIAEINLFGSADLIEAMAHQHHLFTVVERSADRCERRLIRTVTGVVHTPVDGVEAALAILTQPQLNIVSLTITEKGYCSDLQSRTFDLSHPLIQHDLAHPARPCSAIGLLTEALRKRRAAGLAGFTVLSCDNIPANGKLIEQAVITFARHLDDELAQWMSAHVTFPSTMVDRIVPAMDAQQKNFIEKVTGYADPCGVVTEAWRQWVIEDNFIAGRPQWERAGATFVKDVVPFEEMKLRMLNGSHSFLAYCGQLAGYDFISDCMKDPLLKAATQRLMLDEQAKTLRLMPEIDLAEYAQLLITRFSQPTIQHRTRQIAADGSQKIPLRALDACLTLHQRGLSTACLTLLIAAWLCYVMRELRNEGPIDDPLSETLAAHFAKATTPEALALLNIPAVFGSLPQDHPDLIAAICAQVNTIETHGIHAAVRSVI